MTKIDFVIDYDDHSILLSYCKRLGKGRVYTTLNKRGHIIYVVFTVYISEDYFELKEVKGDNNDN